ncbi:MAG: hypothetical protein KatS3mg105_0572 [Gemmatales bacterium]|nr:MAG: hypothetical protein KatS3mg105_0572 [Gemmatales bacterium]
MVRIAVVRGGAKATATKNRFEVRSVKQKRGKRTSIVPAVIRVDVAAPPAAEVTIKTTPQTVSFKVGEIEEGSSKTFKQIAVARRPGTINLTTPDTEDDFPALAKAKDGTVWLAYVSYEPGRPIVMERILAGNFDDLVPKGNGDQIRLVRFDGKTWHSEIDVTDRGLDVWRPTVAVDGQGNVVVAWAQQAKGNWDIYYRVYSPKKKTWSDIVRVTKDPGSDFHVVAATDASGKVWVAWQGWRGNNFDIFLTSVSDGAKKVVTVSDSQANDWCPSIAADSQGNVYVAWDTYDKGNYDVQLRSFGKQNKTWTIAGTLRFEARPDIAVDAKDRVWIAYELGDEQWGKDYSTANFERIGFDKNPGYALYINRTVKVRCLENGTLKQPAEDLEKAFEGKLGRNKSVPQLAIGEDGGVWLLLRHHPSPGGGGEVWVSFAFYYDGAHWSGPFQLPASENLLDNRPPLVGHGKDMLVVYSGDSRSRTQSRGQDDLYASILRTPKGKEKPEMKLVKAVDPEKQNVPVVHKNETEDVARVRKYRIEVGGKELRPIRGEFHRHTEYTAHRDQDGLLEDSWRYALDAGKLDWMGNGDHDNGFHHEYMWWQIQKITDLFHNPPHFVAAQTHERSNSYPNGHRNVIFPRRGIRPLPRGNLKGTPEKGTPDTKMLYRYLKHFGAICASHTSGTNMGTDWRDNDPIAEPIVEIYQGHRHNYEHFGAPRSATEKTQIGGYQPAGFVWNALKKGYRLGFQSSSDHVSTHMSYAVPFVEEESRQGIIDAFKKRHCYAATDNIILVVRSGDHMMGDEFETDKRPALDIHVIGTQPIKEVHVIRNNKYVYTAKPKKSEVKLHYVDMDATPGVSYYYVRIQQTDGNIAWASPMWIKYTGK